MKVIFKILVILVIATLVGGLFYIAVAGSPSNISQTSVPERPVNGDLNRLDREGLGGGIQFPIDSVKNLLIISAISLVYVQGSKLTHGKRSIAAHAQ
jgi:hypothetical protein